MGFPINPPSTPIGMYDGKPIMLSREWYIFFLEIQKLIGGASNPFDDTALLARAPEIPGAETAGAVPLGLPPAIPSPAPDTLPPPPVVSAGFDDPLMPYGAQRAAAIDADKQPRDATLTSLAALAIVQGDIIYGDGTDSVARLAKNANATRYLSNTGASNNPAWAQIDLTNGVTGDLPFANLTQGSALSVLGVAGNGVADVASIAASTDHQVLRRSGTALAFGAIDLTQSAAVTGALTVTNGGTGRATSTTAYALLAAGTTATGAHQTLAAGATTEILVGGGASALPVWTAATGSGAPVRAISAANTGTTTFEAATFSGNVGLGNTSGDTHTVAGNFLLGHGARVTGTVPSRSSDALELGFNSATGNATINILSSASAFLGTMSLGSLNGITVNVGGTIRLTVDATGIDVTGEARCNTLRIDVTPTAATPVPTHTVPMNFNGTVYRVPCVI